MVTPTLVLVHWYLIPDVERSQRYDQVCGKYCHSGTPKCGKTGTTFDHTDAVFTKYGVRYSFMTELSGNNQNQ